ncbi:hypothetical protein MMASJCM_0280 [Mycobacteroides abscessus subsp. massiliense CCUG 48898 = JCM 15300]|nr:hypothetical protein MMASJCM_0280 [Mycobacteroides abscessus subsp. massiliense CCUG 48898 = JCM 15300]
MRHRYSPKKMIENARTRRADYVFIYNLLKKSGSHSVREP